MTLRNLCALLLAGLVAACSQPEETTPGPEAQDAPVAIEAARLVEVNPNRNAYFGDLHVHTRYSFDAFIFGTRHGPDEAYEFAKGSALQHPAGMEMKMKKPLDFQGVADHQIVGMGHRRSDGRRLDHIPPRLDCRFRRRRTGRHALTTISR